MEIYHIRDTVRDCNALNVATTISCNWQTSKMHAIDTDGLFNSKSLWKATNHAAKHF